MTVLALALVAALVATLGVAVVSLRRQVQRLHLEIAELARPVDPTCDTGSKTHPNELAMAELTRTASPGVGRSGRSAGSEPAVPVITAMTGAETGAVPVSAGRVVSVTLAAPLIKAAALSHGVRRALSEDQRLKIAIVFRKELRRQRRIRRRRAQQARRSAPQAGRP
ncbi:MAG: hypothetical protein ACRDPG_07535 [Nocardioidaceae bacterium]